MGICERCGDLADGYNDDGDLLCEDCLFEHVCDEMFDEDDNI